MVKYLKNILPKASDQLCVGADPLDEWYHKFWGGVYCHLRNVETLQKLILETFLIKSWTFPSDNYIVKLK